MADFSKDKDCVLEGISAGRVGSLPPEDSTKEETRRAVSWGPDSAPVLQDCESEEIEVMADLPCLDELSRPFSAAQEDAGVAESSPSVVVDLPAIPAEEEGISEAVTPIFGKRKAESGLSPDRSFFFRGFSEEDEIIFRGPGPSRRRRVLSSEDGNSEQEGSVKDVDATAVDARSTSSVSVAGSAAATGKGKRMKITTKKRASQPGKEAKQEAMLVEETEEVTGLDDKQVLSLCNSLQKWMDEIEGLRSRSGKLQGVISGRMKDIVIRSKKAISSIAGSYELGGDSSFLRMRAKELSLNLKAVEKENSKLKEDIRKYKSNNNTDSNNNNNKPKFSDAVKGETGRKDGGNISNKIAYPVNSAKLAPPPAPSSSKGRVFSEFEQKFGRFVELKAEMLKQIGDMSGIVERYASALLTGDLPAVDPVPAKMAPPGAPAAAEPAKKEEISQVNKSGVRIIADERISSSPYEVVEIPAISNPEDEWVKVVKGRYIRKKGTGAAAAAVAPAGGISTGREKILTSVAGGDASRGVPAKGNTLALLPGVDLGRRTKRKAPTSAAVLLTGASEGFSYSEALKSARKEISLRDLGIESTRIRKAANGGLLIQIPGPGGSDKADQLAGKLERLLPGAAIRRPVKLGEIFVRGLDDSVTVEELKFNFAERAGIKNDSVNVTSLRKMANGSFAAWVSMPLDAAMRAVKEDKMRIGWTVARLELLEARPVQCFKCWHYGHTRYTCKSEINRMGRCFKCGQEGHNAGNCSSPPECMVCRDSGAPHKHRMGSGACSAALSGRSDGFEPRRRIGSSEGNNELHDEL